MNIVKGFDSRGWNGILPAGYQDGYFKFYFQKVSQGQKWIPSDLAQLQKNWKRAKEVYSLPRGAFHFTLMPTFYTDPIAYGKAQGDNFYYTLKNKYGAEFGELPPVIDVENRYTGMAGGDKRVLMLRALLDKTAELFDQSPMIYTAGWYWDAYIHPYVGDWRYWEEYELWEADPPPDTPIKGWEENGIKAKVTQVKLDWTPPGFNTKIDLDETTQEWLDNNTGTPVPPPNCEEAVKKALDAQAVVYEAEIAKLKVSQYNLALNDVISCAENLKK